MFYFTSIQAIADNNTLQTEFNFVPVEVAYVNDILNKLNPRKAVGCDSISQRLLRISAPVISLPLTNLINHFITNRVWPIVWRSSNIIPVFKKADEMDKSNFRPVSVLPALSKIYERIMYDQIYGTFITILSPF